MLQSATALSHACALSAWHTARQPAAAGAAASRCQAAACQPGPLTRSLRHQPYPPRAAQAPAAASDACGSAGGQRRLALLDAAAVVLRQCADPPLLPPLRRRPHSCSTAVMQGHTGWPSQTTDLLQACHCTKGEGVGIKQLVINRQPMQRSAVPAVSSMMKCSALDISRALTVEGHHHWLCLRCLCLRCGSGLGAAAWKPAGPAPD